MYRFTNKPYLDVPRQTLDSDVDAPIEATDFSPRALFRYNKAPRLARITSSDHIRLRNVASPTLVKTVYEYVLYTDGLIVLLVI